MSKSQLRAHAEKIHGGLGLENVSSASNEASPHLVGPSIGRLSIR
ncbi:MAG: hypothetical protein VX970_01215 [Planctomycetota bacterium]|nr:hypothetical protein [Planctomycetota bacterium]